jgi:hypothetical protein
MAGIRWCSVDSLTGHFYLRGSAKKLSASLPSARWAMKRRHSAFQSPDIQDCASATARQKSLSRQYLPKMRPISHSSYSLKRGVLMPRSLSYPPFTASLIACSIAVVHS